MSAEWVIALIFLVVIVCVILDNSKPPGNP